MMDKLKNYLAYIEPISLYYGIIYGITKLIEVSLGSERCFWESMWHKIMDIFGENEAFYTIVMTLYTFILYWTVGIIFLVIEKINNPLSEFKIQKKRGEIGEDGKILQVIAINLRNQLLGVLIAIFMYYVFGNLMRIQVTREAPSFFITILNVIICCVCQEVLYYYVHRILHHRYFYKYHKRHHEFKTPICIVSMYASCVEYVAADLFPVAAGIFLMKCHMSAVLLYITLMTITTLNDHSGYHLPFLHSNELHDYHHLKFNLNYSVYGFLDYIHGTYGHFESSKNFKLHRVFFSLSPIHKEESESVKVL